MQNSEPLTKREWEVLHLVGQGFSNEEIAETLGIEVATVYHHNNHIFGKLGVTSRIQAALKAKVLVYIGQEAGQTGEE